MSFCQCKVWAAPVELSSLLQPTNQSTHSLFFSGLDLWGSSTQVKTDFLSIIGTLLDTLTVLMLSKVLKNDFQEKYV